MIEKVMGGLDVHQATADIAGITRQAAKTCNFLTLYGGGISKLAHSLDVTEDVARRTQNAIFDAAPEIRRFIRQVIKTAESRGYIFNCFGRRSYFDNKNFCYKAPNYLIQGMCADITKLAMVECYEYLLPKKSRMLLTIHDELVFEIAFGEEYVLPQLKTIMENAYKYKHLPQEVDIEYSVHNLSDKSAWGEGIGSQEGDNIQGLGEKEAGVSTEHLGRKDSASSDQGDTGLPVLH